jgi:hypothetical protein
MKVYDKALFGVLIAGGTAFHVLSAILAVTGVALAYLAGGAKGLATLASNKLYTKEEDVGKYLTGNPVDCLPSVNGIVKPRRKNKKGLEEEFANSSIDDLKPIKSGEDAVEAQQEEPLSKPDDRLDLDGGENNGALYNASNESAVGNS